MRSAAAMVTGKRDLLTDDTREVIRKAGIFHIITISGVQMTLMAGIFFVGLRRLLALSPALALRYPIKTGPPPRPSAGAVLYDIATGSRVGTERALFMTLIMLGAVIAGRQSLSMRNLAPRRRARHAHRAGGDPRRELPALLRRRGGARGGL